MATNLQDQRLQSQIGVAVLKKTMDLEKLAGEQLVKMIDETPRPQPAGPGVDLYA